MKISKTMQNKVDEAYILAVKLEAIQEAFKKENKDKIKRLENLKKEIKQYAEKNNLETISGNAGEIKFQSRIENNIDPVKFFDFSVEQSGSEDLFYEVANIPIASAKKHYAEAVLEKEGVLKKVIKKFWSMTFEAI